MKTTLRKRYISDFKAQIVDLFNLGKTVPQLAEDFGVGQAFLTDGCSLQAQTNRCKSAAPPSEP